MQLLNHPKLKITIEAKGGFSYIKESWIGLINSDTFRSLLLKSIDLYRMNVPGLKPYDGKILLYGDASRMEVIKLEDMEYLATYINPLYEEVGITHQAVIMPKDFLSQQSVKNYEEFSKSGKMLTNVFVTEEEAMKWYISERKIFTA
jgi:hypothetical protein